MAIVTKSDGDVLYATDWNSIQTEVDNHGLLTDVSSTDTTEYSEAGESFVLKKTFTFTPPDSNNILLGIKVQADIKTVGTNMSLVRVAVSDGTFTAQLGGAVSPNNDLECTLTSESTTYETKSAQFMCADIFYDLNFNAGGVYPGLFGASSYTIKWYLATNVATQGESYMKNLIVTIYYLADGKVTTSSAKFT